MDDNQPNARFTLSGGPTRWAVPALLILILVLGLLPLWPLDRIAELFHRLNDRDIAMAQAGDELEIELLSVGMSSLAYTSDRQPSHLERMDEDKAELRQAIERLQRAAEGTQQQETVARIPQEADAFLALSRQLIQKADALADLSQRNETRARRLAAQSQNPPGPATGEADAQASWQAASTQFASRLNSLMTDVGQYMARNQTVDRDRLAQRHDQIKATLARLEALAATPTQAEHARTLANRYADFRNALRRQIDQVDALRAMRSQFLEARRELDDVLDDTLQPAIADARQTKRARVSELTSTTGWLQMGFSGLGFILAAGIGLYLVRNERALTRQQRELTEANRTKSDFLANMSHEIRTPMNAVLGMARLMERTELDTQQRDYLHKIRRSSENLLGIINDILDFSRIEADKLSLEDVSFDLDDVLSDVANMAGLRAEEKGLELVYHIDPAVPLALRGDPLRLSQILLNLVTNAVKFTEQGYVVISVAARNDDGDRVILDVSVRDSGRGMTEAEQKRLFEAFTQADTSTTRRYGGTGLGLAIVSHLVHRMGGSIDIDSTPGEGTTFSFSLRLSRATSNSVTTAATDVPLADRYALIVDDVAINRQVLTDILESWSFRVEEAENAEAALAKEEAAREAGRPFSLVLMDWKLPGMDGLAASERLLASERGDRPLVLMVTAHERNDLGERAEAVGVPAVLKKPFTPSTLYNAIASASGEDVTTAQARPEEATVLPRFPGAQVLVAEDNAINSQVVEELLNEAGAQVTCAANGRLALNEVRDRAFDVVLMDAQMPEMDGYTATRELRGDARYANLPIIAMTAHAMAGDREHCLAAGMDEYLAKPIDEKQLFQVLASCLPPTKVEWPVAATAASPSASAPPTGGEEQSARSAADELPSQLPGIDLTLGLKRVGGKAALLQRQLRVFRDEYAQAPELLDRYLRDGDREQAGGYAHAIKGAAGALGMTEVADSAAALEAHCRGDNEGDTQAIVDRLTESLRTACESIDTRLPEAGEGPSPASGTPATTDDTVIADQLRDLAAKLQRNDLGAEASVTALRDQLAGHGMDERLDALEDSVQRLDFGQALDILGVIMEQQGVGKGDE